MQKLSVGLIGYGYWGKRLFKTLQKIRSVRTVAVCDKNQQTIDELQSLDSEIQLTKRYQDIVSNKNIDAVVIATPAETHYQIATDSLKSGKHVLLEKPMALKKADARRLYKFADKKKLILMVDHTYLYAPEIRVAKQTIDSGIIGNIRLIEATRVGPGQYKYDCDVIWDFAPHDISILYYLLGIPRELSAMNFCHLDQHRIDVSNLYFKFTNGRQAFVYLSWLSPIKIRKILIVGTEKTLLIEQDGRESKIYLYPSSCYFRNSGQADNDFQSVKNLRVLSGLPYSEPLSNVCHEFVQCIINHTQPLSSGHLGYEVVNIIETIHRLKSSPARL